MSREIPLTQGLVAIVDDEDYEWLTQWKWHAKKGTRNCTWYAARNDVADGKRITIRMHRSITCAPDGAVVDHLDHNGLNNARANLRVCFQVDNVVNRRRFRRTSGFFKGVYPRASGRWTATIRANKRLIQLGTFDSMVKAALAYDAAAKKHFGEFARLNFPEA